MISFQMLLQLLPSNTPQMRRASEKKTIPTGVRAGLLFIPNESLSLTSLSRLEPFAIHTSPTAAQVPPFFFSSSFPPTRT